MDAKMKITALTKNAERGQSLACACYQIIAAEPAEEQPALMQLFFEYYRKTGPFRGKIDLPKMISDEDEKLFLLTYGDQADEYMVELQKQNMTEEEFYAQLWDYVFTSESFPTTRARMVVFHNIAMDRRIPYFQLDCSGLVSMEDESYRDLSNQMEPEIRKMEFVLHSQLFEQKTQRASLLVHMMEELETDEEKAIFMAKLLTHYETELLEHVLMK